MAADKREDARFSGPYMIQDSDHLSETRQAGGEAGRGGRQSDQSQRGSRQQGGSQERGGGQQGGERTQRRSKLL